MHRDATFYTFHSTVYGKEIRVISGKSSLTQTSNKTPLLKNKCKERLKKETKLVFYNNFISNLLGLNILLNPTSWTADHVHMVTVWLPSLRPNDKQAGHCK